MLNPVAARFPAKTFRICRKCGMIQQERWVKPSIEYNKDYFFDSYKAQYGKTYLEDFPSLKNTGRERVRRMRKLLPATTRNPKILDVGCAYGPFLQASLEAGFVPQGLEPAADAVRYVNDNLKIPCEKGVFPLTGGSDIKNQAPFDALSMWYVIEHFEDGVSVLRQVNELLKVNGVFAFSTPSFTGVSGRKSLKNFLEASPEDHWTVWSPSRVKKLLKLYGFRVKKIVITGRHPERFPHLGKLVKKGSFLYKFLTKLSGPLCLGDTFEVYAVKE
jgi:2-polyprenyl-3-methyl-5-hydroxy-6-metoxy-1,4-benzoquinol methylase